MKGSLGGSNWRVVERLATPWTHATRRLVSSPLGELVRVSGRRAVGDVAVSFTCRRALAWDCGRWEADPSPEAVEGSEKHLRSHLPSLVPRSLPSSAQAQGGVHPAQPRSSRSVIAEESSQPSGP